MPALVRRQILREVPTLLGVLLALVAAVLA
jgi:hypothetical protein